jgi:hypothetical protein
MYAEQAQAGEGDAVSEGSAADDAVDAEFEEVKTDDASEENRQ